MDAARQKIRYSLKWKIMDTVSFTHTVSFTQTIYIPVNHTRLKAGLIETPRSPTKSGMKNG